MIGGLILALRTLTGIPVPGPDARKMSSALPWFPVVGLLIGLAVYWVAITIGNRFLWPEGAAAAAIVTGILITRALHLDGLADCADGFWGGYTREDVLRIMKDPSVGSFGALALIACLLAKWCAITVLVQYGPTEWIIVAFVVSRYVQADLASVYSYARPDGGKAGAFINEAHPVHGALALAVAVALLAGVCKYPAIYLCALPLGWITGRISGFRCRMRIGGMTGDTLGGISELTETVILFAGALSVFADII